MNLNAYDPTAHRTPSAFVYKTFLGEGQLPTCLLKPIEFILHMEQGAQNEDLLLERLADYTIYILKGGELPFTGVVDFTYFPNFVLYASLLVKSASFLHIRRVDFSYLVLTEETKKFILELTEASPSIEEFDFRSSKGMDLPFFHQLLEVKSRNRVPGKKIVFNVNDIPSLVNVQDCTGLGFLEAVLTRPAMTASFNTPEKLSNLREIIPLLEQNQEIPERLREDSDRYCEIQTAPYLEYLSCSFFLGKTLSQEYPWAIFLDYEILANILLGIVDELFSDFSALLGMDVERLTWTPCSARLLTLTNSSRLFQALVRPFKGKAIELSALSKKKIEEGAKEGNFKDCYLFLMLGKYGYLDSNNKITQVDTFGRIQCRAKKTFSLNAASLAESAATSDIFIRLNEMYALDGSPDPTPRQTYLRDRVKKKEDYSLTPMRLYIPFGSRVFRTYTHRIVLQEKDITGKEQLIQERFSGRDPVLSKLILQSLSLANSRNRRSLTLPSHFIHCEACEVIGCYGFYEGALRIFECDFNQPDLSLSNLLAGEYKSLWDFVSSNCASIRSKEDIQFLLGDYPLEGSQDYLKKLSEFYDAGSFQRSVEREFLLLILAKCLGRKISVVDDLTKSISVYAGGAEEMILFRTVKGKYLRAFRLNSSDPSSGEPARIKISISPIHKLQEDLSRLLAVSYSYVTALIEIGMKLKGQNVDGVDECQFVLGRFGILSQYLDGELSFEDALDALFRHMEISFQALFEIYGHRFNLERLFHFHFNKTLFEQCEIYSQIETKKMNELSLFSLLEIAHDKELDVEQIRLLKKLFEISIEGITTFLEGTFHEFDPFSIGDQACQGRALNGVLLAEDRDLLLETKRKFETISQAIPNERRYERNTTIDAFDLSIDPKVMLLIFSYILRKESRYELIEIKGKKRYHPINKEGNPFEGISGSAQLINNMRAVVSHLTVLTVQEEGNQLEQDLPELYQQIRRVHFVPKRFKKLNHEDGYETIALSEMPCFFYTDVILHLLMRKKIPILLKVFSSTDAKFVRNFLFLSNGTEFNHSDTPLEGGAVFIAYAYSEVNGEIVNQRGGEFERKLVDLGIKKVINMHSLLHPFYSDTSGEFEQEIQRFQLSDEYRRELVSLAEEARSTSCCRSSPEFLDIFHMFCEDGKSALERNSPEK